MKTAKNNEEAKHGAESGANVTLLVVDDHSVVREGLVALLSAHRSLRVVGEAANGQEAIAQCKTLKPNVVLMDIRMPVMDGVEATRHIRRDFPQTHVLVLTTYDDDELIWKALEAGAKGYLLKDAPSETLTESIMRVASGQSTLSPEVANKLVHFIGSDKTPRPPVTEEPDHLQDEHPQHQRPRNETGEQLSERELSILRLIAQGTSNKSIAETLFISENTVKTHISNVLRKLDAKDRAEAVAIALTRGLISL